MAIKPLADRVLVEPLEAEEKTAGGIYIPDNAKEKPQKGKIIAAGPGKASENSGETIKMEVKEGDTVLYGKYSGTEVAVDGKDYLIMRESDILAII
ncbi:MAG: co-chaperone GroES [Fibrobacteria bacterium]|nr:co-chaperone GroES [Fibrobacteria bacterium]